MQKLKSKVAIVMLITLATIAAEQTVYAQNATVVGQLTNVQTGEVLGVGLLAGVLLAYQQQRTSTIPWSKQAFFDTILHTAVVTVPIALVSALTQTELNLFGLVLVFFAAIGASVQIKLSRTPSVPTLGRKA